MITFLVTDVRFGDQVIWESIDGRIAGLVVGFANEVEEDTGRMYPYMMVKTLHLATPVKLGMLPEYLQLMKFQIVGHAD